jgi:hypothetical protein
MAKLTTDKFDFSTITPGKRPPVGSYIVAFDIADDLLKKMDHNGILTVIGGGGDPVDIFFSDTYANILSLQSGNLLQPGAWYEITDPTGFPMGDVPAYTHSATIVLNADSVSSFALQGYLKASYPLVDENDVIFYNFGPTNVIGNLLRRIDKRNNDVSGGISSFQWGNDDVKENFIDSTSTVDLSNNTGSFQNNKIIIFSILNISDNSGFIIGNSFNNTLLLAIQNSGQISRNDTMNSSGSSINIDYNSGQFMNNIMIGDSGSFGIGLNSGEVIGNILNGKLMTFAIGSLGNTGKANHNKLQGENSILAVGYFGTNSAWVSENTLGDNCILLIGSGGNSAHVYNNILRDGVNVMDDFSSPNSCSYQYNTLDTSVTHQVLFTGGLFVNNVILRNTQVVSQGCSGDITNNILGPSAIINLDSNSNTIKSNIIGKGGNINNPDLSDNSGIIEYNKIGPDSNIDFSLNSGTISFNCIENSADSELDTNSGIIRRNKIGVSSNFSKPSNSSTIENKRIESGFSNFDFLLDITGLTTVNLLAGTPGGTNAYMGIFNLTSTNATESVDTLVNYPSTHSFEIRPASGLTLTLVHGTGAGNPRLAGGINAVLNGTNGDFIVLQVKPDGNIYQVGGNTF